MTEPRIYLVRHGEAAASWGQSADPGLSELGHAQAQQASRTLLEQLGDTQPLLITSPLQRAQETAAPLAKALGVSVQVDARFREVPSTVSLAERQNWLRGFMRQQWPEQAPGLHAWRRELIEATQELQSSAVVFTHFLVINAVAGWLQDSAATLVFWPDNASITTLARSNDTLSLHALGEQMQTRVN